MHKFYLLTKYVIFVHIFSDEKGILNLILNLSLWNHTCKNWLNII